MNNGSNKFRLAILTISDSGSKGERKDTSGDTISEMMLLQGCQEIYRNIVPDELNQISRTLAQWSDSGEIDLILTTGGTGLSPRDITPEATKAVLDFEVPGIPEAMRMGTLKKTPLAMISRTVAGVRSQCLIINLPGNPTGVRETLEIAIPAIPHALNIMKGARGHPTH